jgi:retron-type reverse transcriptase
MVYLSCGVIQGSILDPILYAIYVSSPFDIKKLTNFADDNFILKWNKQTCQQIIEIEKELDTIPRWLKD